MTKFLRYPALRKPILGRNGRHLGEVIDKTYFTVRHTQHYFVKLKGFGLSVDVLDELGELGVEWIVFEYKGKTEDKYYRVRLNDFIRFSTEYVDDTWGDVDRQFILATDYMTLVKGSEHKSG